MNCEQHLVAAIAERDAAEAKWGDEKLRAEKLNEAIVTILGYAHLASTLPYLRRKITEEVEQLVRDGHLVPAPADDNPDGEVVGT